MPTSITIRPARVADAPILGRLRYEFRASFGTVVEAEPDFVARCTEWIASRLAEDDRWRAWVAVRSGGSGEGAIVGTVWVGSIEKMPNPTPEPELHAYVTNMYVLPEARNDGIGAALLDAALAWCEATGIDAAILWPTSRSTPFYRRHGFAEPEALLERGFGSGARHDAPRDASK